MALERLYNVTYQGDLADLPATLPGGSFFIAKDTKEVYGYDENDLPFLINCCSEEATTCVFGGFITSGFNTLQDFNLDDFSEDLDVQFIRINWVNVQSGVGISNETTDRNTRIIYKGQPIPNGLLGAVLTVDDLVYLKWNFSYNPIDANGDTVIVTVYTTDGVPQQYTGANYFALGFQTSKDGNKWSQECIWGGLYRRS